MLQSCMLKFNIQFAVFFINLDSGGRKLGEKRRVGHTDRGLGQMWYLNLPTPSSLFHSFTTENMGQVR